ncbi:MAG: TIM barrel protein [Chloroflexia bacterium]|nr:TIM barrel protein [Chloroflexia bacterium]
MNVRDMAVTPLVLCSTGVIARGPQAQSEHRIIEIAPRLSADGVEVMIYGSWYGRLDEVAVLLAQSGLSMPVTHGVKSIGPDLVANGDLVHERALRRFDDNCRFTARIGADRVVLHLWGLPDADALIDRQLEALPTLLDIADRHGMMLALEAIPCVVHDPLSLIHPVLETDSRARIALDTEFLGMHGQLDDVFAAGSGIPGRWPMCTSRTSTATSLMGQRDGAATSSPGRDGSRSTAGLMACANVRTRTR